MEEEEEEHDPHTSRAVKPPTTPPGPPPNVHPDEQDTQPDNDASQQSGDILSFQHNITETVNKVETVLHQNNTLLVMQHQLVLSMITGCKQQVDVMEGLLRIPRLQIGANIHNEFSLVALQLALPA